MHAPTNADAPGSTAELLRRLSKTAALPLERAQTLPAELYWRADVYALELERIFAREWICVGRVEQLEKPGDYLSIDLAGEPLLLTRDEVGALHALSRVCRHRYLDLFTGVAEKSGNLARLVCPYHLWSYRMNGQLAGAPEMNGAQEFDRSRCRLPEFRLETWQGFVFVNLDPDAAPLAPRMAGVERVLDGRDMSDWRTVGTLDWGDTDVNWKIVIENGSECYHHMGTHRATLQPIWPAAGVTIDESSPEWFVGTMRVSDAFAVGSEDGHPIHPTFFPTPVGLTAQQRSVTIIVGVFPMFFFALSPDFCSWFRWYPTGPTSHHLDIHVVVPPASAALPDLDARVAEAIEAIRVIQTEDATTNAGVQRGCRARAATPGRLSAMEEPLWQLQRFLASRLVDTPA